MKEGKVIVGFSNPYVAKYNNAGGTVTYTDGRRLARGVKVSLDVESSDDNDFYADDAVAESENGQFAGGKVNLTVDGLLAESEKFIAGLPEPETLPISVTINGEKVETQVKVYKHGKKAVPPYLAVGFIVQYRSGGINTFVPYILTKAKFQTTKLEAATRENETSWQTQDLVAELHRDDTADNDWRWILEDQESKEMADAILRALLNVTAEQTTEE